jgi:hypothetical protein
MMADEKPADPARPHPAINDYRLVGGAALFVMTIVLAQSGLSWWSVLPGLVGVAMLLESWTVGPSLVLLLLSALLLTPWAKLGLMSHPETSLATSCLLAAATIVYLGCAYRVQTLSKYIFPIRQVPNRWVWLVVALAFGPIGVIVWVVWLYRGIPTREELPGTRRTSGRWLFSRGPRVRPAEQVRIGEVIRLVVAGVVSAVLALLLWIYLEMSFAEGPFGLRRELWHAATVVTLGGLGWVLLRGVLGYLRLLQYTNDEARLFLQDQMWTETRREQSLLWQWLAEDRIRKRRK